MEIFLPRNLFIVSGRWFVTRTRPLALVYAGYNVHFTRNKTDDAIDSKIALALAQAQLYIE